jgi:membrane fusion protein, heavy metal efflux system
VRYRFITLALVVASAGSIAGCSPPTQAKDAGKPAAPKPADKHSDEAQLATVKLSQEQETRLGLATTEAAIKKVPKTRTYGGDVTIPPGKTILVAAPLGGTLADPDAAVAAVKPGSTVKKGQIILTLTPILAPDALANFQNQLVDVKGQVGEAQKSLELATQNLNRADGLFKKHDISRAQLDDVRTQFDLAKATLRRGETRRDALEQTMSALRGGELVKPIPIAAEADGLLRAVSALPGQVVASGQALFEIVSLDLMWIRVPVFVGDLTEIVMEEPAAVGGLTDAPGAATVSAPPVSAPPSADPLAASVDLYFQVDNKNASLRPGQRVGATLALKGEAESIVVPKTAIVRDYFGSAWVYELTAPHTYVRRRVIVDRVVGPLAVIVAGIKSGAKVVTTATAELMGTDFGFSK